MTVVRCSKLNASGPVMFDTTAPIETLKLSYRTLLGCVAAWELLVLLAATRMHLKAVWILLNLGPHSGSKSCWCPSHVARLQAILHVPVES